MIRYGLDAEGKDYDTATYEHFHRTGAQEIDDFVFLNPKPHMVPPGGPLWSDIYGNSVKNLPPNVTVTFKGYFSKIEFRENVTFSPESSIEAYSKINFFGEKNTSFGFARFLMYPGCSVSFGRNNRIIRLNAVCGPGAHIEIGNNNTFFGLEWSIEYYSVLTIGDGCLFSSKVVLRTDSHLLWDVKARKPRNIKIIDPSDPKNQIVIGNHVWIGYDVSVLVPSFIGSGCNVGTRALLKKAFPNNCSIAGIPARIIHKDSAWSRDPFANDMLSSCGDKLYSVSTIELDRVSDMFLKKCRKTTDINEYLDILTHIKNKLVAIALKDTSGMYLDSKINEGLHKLGFSSDLTNLYQYAFIGIIEDDRAVYEKLAAEPNVPEEYECEVAEISLRTVSQPRLCGNVSEIFVNGFDYSVSTRGLNIVVIDKETKQVVDTVGFDTHIKNTPCCRKISTY